MSFLRVLLFTLISYYLILHLGFCKAYQNCLVALIQSMTVDYPHCFMFKTLLYETLLSRKLLFFFQTNVQKFCTFQNAKTNKYLPKCVKNGNFRPFTLDLTRLSDDVTKCEFWTEFYRNYAQAGSQYTFFSVNV